MFLFLKYQLVTLLSKSLRPSCFAAICNAREDEVGLASAIYDKPKGKA